MRMYLNYINGIFVIHRPDQSILYGSELHIKATLIGRVVSLSPNVHILVNVKELKAAMRGQYPQVRPIVTRWPHLRLIINWLKDLKETSICIPK